MQYKVKIEVLLKPILPLDRLKHLIFRRVFFPAQARKFRMGLKITNIGISPLKGADISSVRITSAQGQDIVDDFPLLHIDTLNPNQEYVTWFSTVATYMHGLVSLGLKIFPTNPTEDNIETFQVNHFTREVNKIPDSHGHNAWIDFFYIRSKNEYVQNNTNYLLLVVAIITLFGGWTGAKSFFIFIVNHLHEYLRQTIIYILK